MKRVSTAIALALILHAGGCAKLPGMNSMAQPIVKPVPEVKVVQVTLETRPTNQMLAAYYCNEAAGGGLAGMACRVLGAIPRKNDLQFTFKVELEAKNPSTIPMPVVSALVAFAAYPEAQGTPNLGSVCVSMCEDPANCPQVADACNSSEPTIKGMNDFANAAAGFLLTTALHGGSPAELRMPLVQPGSSLKFIAGLTLGLDQMLALMKTMGGDLIKQATRGQTPKFVIPWAVEGSVWVNFEGFGRIGAGFPRQTGEWALQ